MKKFLLFFLLAGAVNFVHAQMGVPIPPKVVIDNEKIKVTEYNSAPGGDVCGPGKHHHEAHLTVLLTEATVKVTGEDGKITEQKAPAGTTFWSEAGTHTVVNNGDKPMRIYIIETKN